MSTINTSWAFRSVVWIILFSVAGCTTVEPTYRIEALSQWVGLHFYDALFQLGKPLEVYSDGLTGRVIVYPAVTLPPTGQGSAPEDSLDTYDYIVWDHALDRAPPTYVSQQYDMLYVDKDGWIYSFQSNESDRQFRTAYEESMITAGVIGGIVLVVLLVMTAQAGDY